MFTTHKGGAWPPPFRQGFFEIKNQKIVLEKLWG
jgi:hypothetical protein